MPGRCLPVAAGDDPADECANEPASTCGRDGTCDGLGACRLHLPDTPCGPALCESRSLSGHLCDGAGVCQKTEDTSCGAYVCAPSQTACLTGCSTSADCAAPFVCHSGACQTPKALGAACANGGECSSGFCQQGVCCGTPCDGLCLSCADSSPGQCLPVPAGQDPLEQCTDQGATSCGLDGTCDGSGACRRYLAGTECGPGSCTNGSATPARVCDGKGLCLDATATSCSPYLCRLDKKCLNGCMNDGDCVSGATCKDGACVASKKANGQACAGGGECLSGHCAQGLCCDRACSGDCEHCNLAGSAGTCTMVPSGQDPLDQCAEQNDSTCGNDGNCDGAGRCRLYAAGTVCAAATCTGGTLTGARRCDGSGACGSAPTTSCGNYACQNAACLATCTSSQDCVSPSVCLAGACGGLKGDYYQGINFESLKTTRTDPYIDWQWPAGTSPAPGSLSSDNFSIRWSGKVTPRYSQTYTFYTVTDDGVRLWVDGNLLINDWDTHSATERSGTITLQADQAYDIRMEYFEAGGAASARLLWSSPSQAKEVIPTSRLSP